MLVQVLKFVDNIFRNTEIIFYQIIIKWES
jgi:hypothetical protein